MSVCQRGTIPLVSFQMWQQHMWLSGNGRSSGAPVVVFWNEVGLSKEGHLLRGVWGIAKQLRWLHQVSGGTPGPGVGAEGIPEVLVAAVLEPVAGLQRGPGAPRVPSLVLAQVVKEPPQTTTTLQGEKK